jgi:hypothetical protein
MCIARHSDIQKPCVAGLSVEKNPDKSAHRRSEPNYAQVLSQNTRGFDNDKEEMVLAIMQLHCSRKMYYPNAIQETWKLGDGLFEKYGFLVIQHGSDIKDSRGHNSGCVAIIPSPEARKAWVAAGSCVKHYVNRIFAIKILFMDANRKPVIVVLASAYAPIGAAKESIRQDFATQLERCFDAPKFVSEI